ncbi:MAG: hypothetical protein IJX08_09845 [Clostridia bacterium]|nr:hypothetical protein [Clostridia bacterium]
MTTPKISSESIMNKQVFMIMCHKNASQVLRLAQKCISEYSDVIVHADSYMPQEEFLLLKEFERHNPQFVITNRRLHGELNRESLVHIAMEMVQTALQLQRENNWHYQYFCLLSGQDYLIKPVSFITEELAKHYPKPYIDCDPYDKRNWMYKKLRWNTFTNKIRLKIDSIFNNKHRNPLRVFCMVLVLFLTKIMHIGLPSIYHQIKRKGVGVFGGSAWWILPDIAIEYIYDQYSKSGELVNLILQAITPEELFFQIMSMQSPIKDLVEVSPKNKTGQNCKTWAYFYDDDKPPKNHPYIFTVNEFQKLIHSDRWIARKFDENIDSEILDMLDEYCKQQLTT